MSLSCSPREDLNGKLYLLCCEMESTGLETAIQDIHDTASIEKATRIAVDFLISQGTPPDRIKTYCEQHSIELPRSIYTDWGLLNEFGKISFMGSIQANIRAIQLTGSRWFFNNWMSILGTWAIVEMVLSAVRPIAAEEVCQAPDGSYTKTCTVKSSSLYKSSDPNLKEIDFCRFKIECEKMGGKGVHINEKVLPAEDVHCLTAMENCDGHLILRSGNERLCLDEHSIRQQLKFNRKDEL